MEAAVKLMPALAKEPPEPSLAETEADSTSVGGSTAALQDPWAKVRALAVKQLDRFMSFEPKVLRGDDVAAIHDMRVASRRLQQIFDLLYPTPHGEGRKLRRRIRRTRRALGEVRNVDVQLARVRRILRRKRTARREAWEALHDYLVGERTEHFGRAVGKLGRLNLAAFYVRMKEVVMDSALLPADGVPTSSAFAERVSCALVRVWQDFDLQVEASHRDSQSSVIHGVRIAAKRLRYLVEVLHEFDAAGSVETLKWLRGVQELLGDWHDLEVLEQVMVAMVARQDYLRDNLGVAMEVEKLILKCRADKGKFREQYFRRTLEGAELQRVRIWANNLALRSATDNP